MNCLVFTNRLSSRECRCEGRTINSNVPRIDSSVIVESQSGPRLNTCPPCVNPEVYRRRNRHDELFECFEHGRKHSRSLTWKFSRKRFGPELSVNSNVKLRAREAQTWLQSREYIEEDEALMHQLERATIAWFRQADLHEISQMGLFRGIRDAMIRGKPSKKKPNVPDSAP